MADHPTQNERKLGIDKIDVNDEASVQQWAKRLDVTEDQIRDAVKEVGSEANDVEMHLKGSRSTTNAAQEEKAETAEKAENSGAEAGPGSEPRRG